LEPLEPVEPLEPRYTPSSVNRTYFHVVLLEAAIIAGLIVLGRFFS
jgi:hypothetical protein